MAPIISYNVPIISCSVIGVIVSVVIHDLSNGYSDTPDKSFFTSIGVAISVQRVSLSPITSEPLLDIFARSFPIRIFDVILVDVWIISVISVVIQNDRVAGIVINGQSCFQSNISLGIR